MNPIRIEALSDSASLIAGCIHANVLNKVAISSVEGANNLAVVNDYLAPGVLVDIAYATLDVPNSSMVNHIYNIPTEPPEDTEDGVRDILGSLLIELDSDIIGLADGDGNRGGAGVDGDGVVGVVVVLGFDWGLRLHEA